MQRGPQPQRRRVAAAARAMAAGRPAANRSNAGIPRRVHCSACRGLAASRASHRGDGGGPGHARAPPFKIGTYKLTPYLSSRSWVTTAEMSSSGLPAVSSAPSSPAILDPITPQCCNKELARKGEPACELIPRLVMLRTAALSMGAQSSRRHGNQGQGDDGKAAAIARQCARHPAKMRPPRRAHRPSCAGTASVQSSPLAAGPAHPCTSIVLQGACPALVKQAAGARGAWNESGGSANRRLPGE